MASSHSKANNGSSSCDPTTEWRTPPLEQAYDVALTRAVKRWHARQTLNRTNSTHTGTSVHYIGVRDIVWPKWDTALDWCHYFGDKGGGDVIRAEAAHVWGLVRHAVEAGAKRKPCA
jgi:hypothetical protein